MGFHCVCLSVCLSVCLCVGILRYVCPPSQAMNMLVAKAKEQEERLSQLSQIEVFCSELQLQMEAAKSAGLECQQETQVRMHVAAWASPVFSPVFRPKGCIWRPGQLHVVHFVLTHPSTLSLILTYNR